ncbi:GNAT family N-acetyltransferase [Mucilaginibacter gilvus]|uniref:N-acetyltransferase n=1 Tax=Mucilaginibacter gilvus TaxID=2305909 RepID=A0A444MRJ2_9SPHI|nr:GNAT family N-acetyltransferase [Mucilaginibacter gilvus]RWY54276.1 N-acetyltransferase [Mucilaginibacter gilvus]
MEFSFEMCYKFGDIWLSDDDKACALILYPQKKCVSLKLSLLRIRLLLTAITSSDYKSRQYHLAAMEKMRPNLDMALIWYIGVDPNYQNRGIGTRLITQVLQRIKSCSLPVYLELSAYQYLGWFERFGFEGYEVYDCADYKFVNFFLKNDLK